MPLPLLAVSVLGLVALGVLALLAWREVAASRAAQHDRDVVTAHWESLVMQRRDLRLAVDAAGVPALHGRAGLFGYVIRVGDEGPSQGRPWACAAAITAASSLTVRRHGDASSTLPDLADGLRTGDDDFDAVFEVRCDDADAARACLGPDVRAAMLALPAAWACLDDGGLRLDLGSSATAVDHALVDALRDLVVAVGRASSRAVAAG